MRILQYVDCQHKTKELAKSSGNLLKTIELAAFDKLCFEHLKHRNSSNKLFRLLKRFED